VSTGGGKDQITGHLKPLNASFRKGTVLVLCCTQAARGRTTWRYVFKFRAEPRYLTRFSWNHFSNRFSVFLALREARQTGWHKSMKGLLWCHSEFTSVLRDRTLPSMTCVEEYCLIHTSMYLPLAHLRRMGKCPGEEHTVSTQQGVRT